MALEIILEVATYFCYFSKRKLIMLLSSPNDIALSVNDYGAGPLQETHYNIYLEWGKRVNRLGKIS